MRPLRDCYITLLLLPLLLSPLRAQSLETEQIKALALESLEQLLAEGLISPEQSQAQLELLEHWLAEPLDLNTASSEELRQFALLSEYQIYHLIKARTDRGGFFGSIYDLKLVQGWDERLLRRLMPFVRVVPRAKPRPRLLEGGASSAALTSSWSNRPLREALGGPLATSIRWQYHTRGGLSAFFAAEQDQGEPWSYEGYKGFDAYSGHLSITRLGSLRQIVLGDYRAAWGLGLILSQGYMLSSLGRPLRPRPGRGLTPVSGTAEGNKLRGLALEWEEGSWQLSAFLSKRWLDGRIDEQGVIYGLSESGLHRSPAEWRRRAQIPMSAWGLRLGYSTTQLWLALQHLSYRWAGYRLATAQGARGIEQLSHLSGHGNSSLSYLWLSGSGATQLSGELARSALGSWAVVQQLWHRFEGVGDLALELRYFSPLYWAYYSAGVGMRPRPRDEEGVRLSLERVELSRGLELGAAVDLYRAVGRASEPKQSRAHLLSLDLLYHPQPSLALTLFIRHHQRPEGTKRQRIRLAATFSSSEATLRLGTTLLNIGHRTKRQSNQRAWAFDARLSGQIDSGTHWWISGLYFDAPLWQTRLYSYEPRTSFDYTPHFVWGKGWRLTLGVKWRIANRLGLEAKIAHLERGRLSAREQQLWLVLRLR